MKRKSEVRIITNYLHKETQGAGDLIDLTPDLHRLFEKAEMLEGTATVFNIGSTAAITTFEFENGLIQDMRELYEKLAPSDRPYHHDATWHDDNGFSHVRAALQGPSLSIPFAEGKLLLGTWQQVVLAEFDNRPRKRKIVVQFLGC